MKIERGAVACVKTLDKSSLKEGGVYLGVEDDDVSAFIVTDEGSAVYLSSGVQYAVNDFSVQDRFVQLNVKLVIE